MSDIRQRAYFAWLTLFLGFCAMDVEAQAETELLRDVLSKPIKIERDEVVNFNSSPNLKWNAPFNGQHKRFHWRVCVRYWLTHNY